MKEKLRKFMIGRYISHYGVDALSKFLFICLILIPIGTAFIYPEVSKVSNIILIFLLYFRAFSKNLSARYAENQKFLEIIKPLTSFYSRSKRILTDRKHKYVKCSNCKQELRLPRKKGKIKAKCKKCGHEFIIRT